MINWMTKEDVRYMPPLRDEDHGWLIIKGENWLITNWHHFDDFGQTIETVTVKHPLNNETQEVYSLDEGQSWHTELP